MPQTQPKHNFDVDLDFGQIWERRVCNIFENNGSLEIKADKIWHKSGNLAFEFKYKGHDSGIAKSQALWWVSVLTSKDDPDNTELILIWKTEKLKELLRKLCKEKKADIMRGGDGGNSEMVLAKIDDLLPAVIQEKPWSNVKTAYDNGFQAGVKHMQDFYNNEKNR